MNSRDTLEQLQRVRDESEKLLQKMISIRFSLDKLNKTARDKAMSDLDTIEGKKTYISGSMKMIEMKLATLNKIQTSDPSQLSQAQQQILNKIPGDIDASFNYINKELNNCFQLTENLEKFVLESKKPKEAEVLHDARPLYDSLLEGTQNLSNQAKSVFSKNCFKNAAEQASGDKDYLSALHAYMNMHGNINNASFDLYKDKFLDLLKQDKKNNGLVKEIESVLDSGVEKKSAMEIIDNFMILNYLNDNDRGLYIKNMNSLGQTWNLLQGYETSHANTKNRTANLNMARVHVAKDTLEKTGDMNETLKILDGIKDHKHPELASGKKNSFISSSLFSKNARVNEKVFDTMKWTIKKINGDVKSMPKELGNTSIRRPGK